MFNLFTNKTQPKINMTAVHSQYKNKQLSQEEYTKKIRQALYENLVSDEIRKKIQDMGLDMFNLPDDYTPTCDRETLEEIANELSRSSKAVSDLVKALSGITPNETYKWPSEKYKGKPIISHKEWHTFYDNAKFEKQNLVSSSCTSEELFKYFVKMKAGSFSLLTHAVVIKYMNLIFRGATIV